MNNLIKEVKRHIQFNGERPLTNKGLLRLLEYAKHLDMQDENKHIKFLEQLENECCNPND